MYEKHFGLLEAPFMINPNPKFFKLTPSHAESLAKCEYAIRNRSGLAVVYGDVGTGKTTMMFELMDRFNTDEFTIAWTDQVSVNTDTAFLKTISEEFGVKPKRSKLQTYNELQEFLATEVRQGRTPLLLVDEAHKLESYRRDRDMLGLIQSLTNWVDPTSHTKLIQIVLFGELGLLDLIKPHRALKRRVAQFGFLSPLTTDDAWEVLNHRWTIAGGHLPVPIDNDAFTYLYESTKGLPSDLIKTVNSALMYAWGMQLNSVNLESAKYAISENQIDTDHLKEEHVE